MTRPFNVALDASGGGGGAATGGAVDDDGAVGDSSRLHAPAVSAATKIVARTMVDDTVVIGFAPASWSSLDFITDHLCKSQTDNVRLCDDSAHPFVRQRVAAQCMCWFDEGNELPYFSTAPRW